MALNKFTDEQAIEHCISLRDRLEFNDDLDLVAKWADKDALAQVINLADKQTKKKVMRATLLTVIDMLKEASNEYSITVTAHLQAKIIEFAAKEGITL